MSVQPTKFHHYDIFKIGFREEKAILNKKQGFTGDWVKLVQGHLK